MIETKFWLLVENLIWSAARVTACSSDVTREKNIVEFPTFREPIDIEVGIDGSDCAEASPLAQRNQ